MEDDAATALTDAEEKPFTFEGEGFEYFKIWIVNIILTILTLGIYSAWAKVRNKRYFYSNLYLDGHHFEYLAEPIAILKGRLIAIAALLIYLFTSTFMPVVGAILAIGLMILMPWLIVRSLAFNNRMSAYRNVQFRFHGNYGGAAMVMFVWPLVGVLTLGLLYPLALLRMNQYIVNNSAYGTGRFEFHASFKDYFIVFLVILGFILLASLLSALLTPLLVGTNPDPENPATFIATLPLMAVYFFVFVYATVSFGNIFYNMLSLRDHTFEANLELGSMGWLIFTNFVFIVLTLGLFLPVAKVRTTHYLANHIVLMAAEPLDTFTAAEREQVSALGEEFGEVFDFDIGVT